MPPGPVPLEGLGEPFSVLAQRMVPCPVQLEPEYGVGSAVLKITIKAPSLPVGSVNPDGPREVPGARSGVAKRGQ